MRSWPVATMGVEEEFFLLHPDGSAASVAPRVIAALRGEVEVHPEWMQFQVETVTGVCTDLKALMNELASHRRSVARAANSVGAVMVATGTPPFAVPGLVSRTEGDRYRWLQDRFPEVAGEVVSCGCHVHVGVPTRELGVEVLNRVRAWLPVLLALAGNSPLWRGQDSGRESYRHELFSRWPTATLPPRCDDVVAYDAALERCIAVGQAADSFGVYWFARLSPRFPTVEIRIADVGLTVSDSGLLAALCRALVATAMAEAIAGLPVAHLPEPLLDRALSAAACHGLEALLVDPRNGLQATGHTVLHHLVEHVGPALAAAGDHDTVAGLLSERRGARSGATRQRMLRCGADQETFISALAAASLADVDGARCMTPA
jgi:carboxylate-amine ligase